MKKTIALITTASIMGFAAQTFATEGFYAQAEVGWTGHHSMPNVTLTSKSHKQFGGHFGLGYLACLNDLFNWGAEVGYGYYGETEWKNTSTNLKTRHTTTAADFLLVGEYKFNPKFTALLKAGTAYVYEKIETPANLPLAAFANARTDTERAFKPMVVVGGAYNFADNLDFIVNYTHIFGRSVSTSSINNFKEIPSINALFAGIRYTFS